VIQYIAIKDVNRFTASDGISDLANRPKIEADGRFDGNPGVVVCAYNAGMVFVNLSRSVDRVVHHIIPEPVFADGSVDGLIIDKISTRGVDQGGVRLHGTKAIVGDYDIISSHVERDGITLTKEGHRMVYSDSPKFRCQFPNVVPDVVHEQATSVTK